MQWEGGLVNALADHAVHACRVQIRALVDDGTNYITDWCRNRAGIADDYRYVR